MNCVFDKILFSFFLCVGFVCDLEASPPWTILPLGDSITVGLTSQENPGAGYREPLYEALVEHSKSVLMLGANDIYSTPAPIAAGQQFHAGFGCYSIAQIDANLDDDDPLPRPAPGNCGGYWITGKVGLCPAISPDIILLMAGTIDIASLDVVDVAKKRLDHLLSRLYLLCP